VLVVFAGGPFLVPLLWGGEYAGVLPHLLLVSPAVLAQPLVRTALSLAVVESRLRRNLELGLVSVTTFAAAAWLLVPRLGALGVTAAIVVSSVVLAVVAIAHLRTTAVLAQARGGRHLLAAAPAAVMLVATRGSVWGAALGIPLYVALLFGLGVLRWNELRFAASALLRERRAVDGVGTEAGR
jgi:O-antigen/teichoic acid export membrane protein